MSDKAFVWRKRDEHSRLFEDGERLLVALRVVYTARGESTNIGDGSKCYWHVEPITIECDEDYFNIKDISGETWGWDWSDVEYWLPLDRLISSLPPAKATLAEAAITKENRHDA